MARLDLELPPAGRIYSDGDVSGTIPLQQRPGGRRLLDDLQGCGGRAVVWVDDASRLSRENTPFAWTDFIRFCAERGIRAFFVDLGIWSDDENSEILLSLAFKTARKFSHSLSRRAAGALVTLAKRGAHTGGRPPYGYDRLLCDASGTPLARFTMEDDGTLVEYDLEDNETRRYPLTLQEGKLTSSWVPKNRSQYVVPIVSIVAERVTTVQRIFQLYAEGSSRADIADLLNREGIPTPAQNRWTSTKLGWDKSTVSKILGKAKYTGRWDYGLTGQGKFHRLAKGANGEVLPLPVEEVGHTYEEGEKKGKLKKTQLNEVQDQISHTEPELAIVSPEVYEACRSRGRKRRPPCKGGAYSNKLDRSSYLLTSIIKCDNCGYAMSGSRASRKVQPRTYRCNTWVRNKAFCVHNTVASDLLDAYVLGLVQDWVSNVDRKALRAAVREEVKGQQGPVSSKSEVEDLQKEIAKLKGQREAILANCRTPGLSPAFMANLSTQHDELLGKEEAIRAQLVEAEATQRQPLPRRTVKQRVDAILADLDSLAERLESSDLATKKAAIRAVVKEVRVKATKFKLKHTPHQREVVVLSLIHI